MNHIHHAIITFQGFTESEDAATGTEDLFFDVVRQFASPTVTTYHPRRWCSDVENLLDQLIRQRIHDVVLIGYSWGAGFACQKFAKLAPEWGIKVDLMLLCDPVYRPTWVPAWLGANPLAIGALLRTSKIHIPPSVRRVAWVRQNISVPAGHDLKAESPIRTHILPAKILPYSHTTIDGSSEWFNLVRSELATLLHRQDF
jgi:pimeloyl-ACP methyl ester carboxylesterase